MAKAILLLVLVLFCRDNYAQEARIVFYNVENLCDVENDPLTRDDEFLPEGEKNWTTEKMMRKVFHIYQVLVAIGEGEMPAVVGLCEIENRMVLNRLIYDTPLKKLDYRIIHSDSPDARGMDVAILYRPDIFTPDSVAWLQVPLAGNETTREILMVRGLIWDEVTVYIYVNHWPSRFSGAGSSTPKRVAAATVLSVSVKDVYEMDPMANVIITGDFNDGPNDESMLVLNKILDNEAAGPSPKLVNLSTRTSFLGQEGTIKHQGTWSVFDQVIVSEPLFNGLNGCKLLSETMEVCREEFLFEPDLNYTGKKPYRTYSGPGWRNGFSDHLPVGIRIGAIRND